MENITAKTPWKDYMGDVPMHLEYPKGTMYDAVTILRKDWRGQKRVFNINIIIG